MRIIIWIVVFLACLSLGLTIDKIIIHATVEILANPDQKEALLVIVSAVILFVTILPILYISSIVASLVSIISPFD